MTKVVLQRSGRKQWTPVSFDDAPHGISEQWYRSEGFYLVSNTGFYRQERLTNCRLVRMVLRALKSSTANTLSGFPVIVSSSFISILVVTPTAITLGGRERDILLIFLVKGQRSKLVFGILLEEPGSYQ